MNLVSVASATSNLQAVPRSSSQQSTNLRAVSLPAVRVKPADRSYFIGGSDGCAIMGSDKAPLLRLWRERRGDEPEDLLKCRCFEANAGQAPAVFFRRRLPRWIVLILLFASREQALTHRHIRKVSSNQLVQSKPQENLR